MKTERASLHGAWAPHERSLATSRPTGPLIVRWRLRQRNWRHAIGKIGAPGRIRTSGPQIRSLVLYPAELRARGKGRHRGWGKSTQPRLRLRRPGTEPMPAPAKEGACIGAEPVPAPAKAGVAGRRSGA